MSHYGKMHILLLMMLLLTMTVSAQGGFMSGDNIPIHQNNFSVVYEVNRETNTIRMVIHQQYVGEVDRFAWVIPIPDASPVIETENAETANQPSTTLQFNMVDSPCTRLFQSRAVGSGGPERDRPQASEFATLSGDEVLLWLDEQDYHYSHEVAEVIRSYATESMSFVVFPLTQLETASSGNIQRVAITYQGDTNAVRLPLRLAAFSTGLNPEIRNGFYSLTSDVPIWVQIVSDVQYVPANYTHVTLPFDQMRAPSPFVNLGNYGNGLSVAFLTLKRTTLENAPPQSFVTTFAGHDEDSPQRYVTRLEARLAPSAMTIDPVFVPAPNTPDLNEIDLVELVNPLHYYQCSTRTIDNEELFYTYDGFGGGRVGRFPDYDTMTHTVNPAHTWIDELRTTVFHPQDWIISEIQVTRPIEIQGEVYDVTFDLMVFAPEPVTVDTIVAFEAGQETPPMLVVSVPIQRYEVEGEFPGLYYFSIEGGHSAAGFHRPNYGYCCNVVDFDLLVSEDDWHAHEVMYQAMLDFPRTYTFFAHPDLRHTLFINSRNYEYHAFEIGYPDGWIEYMDNDNQIYFLPEAETDREYAITLDFEQGFNGGHPFYSGYNGNETPEEWIEARMDEFHLLPEARTILEQASEGFRCWFISPPLPFEHEEQRGYVVLSSLQTLVISTATNAPISDDILRAMAESFNLPTIGCG